MKKDIIGPGWNYFFDKLKIVPPAVKEVERIIHQPATACNVHNVQVRNSPDIEYAMSSRVFRMRDFFGISRTEFLHFTYTALLRRELDHAGSQTWVPHKDKWHERLRVVISIASSAEAKQKKVGIKHHFFWSLLSAIIQKYKKSFSTLRSYRKKAVKK